MADKKILGSLEVTGTIGDGTNTLSVQDIVNKEDKSNKVALGSTNTTNQYPNAKSVWDECQNIREVAEGKTSTYVISDDIEGLTEQTFVANEYKRADGTPIATWADFLSYVDDSNTCSNTSFDNDSEYGVDIGYTYFITTNNKIIKSNTLKNGDNIYVVQLNVPDRWFNEDNGYAYPLETSKVNLDNYSTKTETSTEVNKVAHDIAVEYDENTLYGSGDLCIKDKLLYKCNTDDTTGTWDSSKWDLTTVNSELGVIKASSQSYTDNKLLDYVTKINCHLPEYQFNTENIISTIEQYGLANKAIIVNTPSHKMIVYITERLNVYTVNGYELRQSAFIGFQVQPTSTWAVIPSQFMIFDYQMKEYSKRYIGTYVGAEDEFSEEMNVGDIIMESTGGQFLINEIEFDTDNSLTKVILVGLEDNGNPVVHKFESGTWSTSNYINSNFVDLTTVQTISAEKNFSGGIKTDSIDTSGSINFKWAGAIRMVFGNQELRPQNANYFNLGSSAFKWNNLFLSGRISDGINSVTVANIQPKLTAGTGIEISNNVISSTLEGIDYEVDAQLPATGQKGIIYLIPNGESGSENIYNEYIWIPPETSGSTGRFEFIGTTETDLSNYVTTNTEQTITGDKTFSNGVDIGTIKHNGTVQIDTVSGGKFRSKIDNRDDLGDSTHRWKDLYLAGGIRTAGIYATDGTLKLEITTGVVGVNNILRPTSNGTRDLGTSSNRWRDLYVARSIYVGSYVEPNTDVSARLGHSTRRFTTVFTQKIGNNNQNYGLTVPDTTSWTANKEIATKEDLDTKQDKITATAADAGKVVIVDANGNLVLEEPSGKLSKVATITLSCTTTETAKTPNSTTGTIDYTKPMIIQISPNQNITGRAIYGGQYSGDPYFYCRASDVTTVNFDIYQ